MPLPGFHFKSLERQLRIHEERLALLRRQLKDILEGELHPSIQDPNPKDRSPEWLTAQHEVLEREILIHEQLIELGRDPKVLDALADLAESRDYARYAALDPKRAARKRGIELPAEMTLRLDLEPDRVQLQINYYEDLFPFMVTWNSDSGFSAPRELGSSQKKTSDVSLV